MDNNLKSVNNNLSNKEDIKEKIIENFIEIDINKQKINQKSITRGKYLNRNNINIKNLNNIVFNVKMFKKFKKVNKFKKG